MSNFKKMNAELSTITRDISKLNEKTGNLYESLTVIGRRANQIQVQLKEEIKEKLEEFVSVSDNLDEVLENREQIEISRYYERLPKPNAIAYQEWLEGQIFFRNETTGHGSEGSEK
jgi:DNA-directed RNA polymerase subunit K/omega